MKDQMKGCPSAVRRCFGPYFASRPTPARREPTCPGAGLGANDFHSTTSCTSGSGAARDNDGEALTRIPYAIPLWGAMFRPPPGLRLVRDASRCVISRWSLIGGVSGYGDRPFRTGGVKCSLKRTKSEYAALPVAMSLRFCRVTVCDMLVASKPKKESAGTV